MKDVVRVNACRRAHKLFTQTKCSYFDYRRRNDATFRRSLGKEYKRVRKAEAKKAAASATEESTLIDSAVSETQAMERDGRIPAAVDMREQYFMEQVSLGEMLFAQGKPHYVDAAIAFFRALKVYPSPYELIVIYQKTVPPEVLDLVMKMVAKDVGAPAPGSEGGVAAGGLEAAAQAAAAAAGGKSDLNEIDDDEEETQGGSGAAKAAGSGASSDAAPGFGTASGTSSSPEWDTLSGESLGPGLARAPQQPAASEPESTPATSAATEADDPPETAPAPPAKSNSGDWPTSPAKPAQDPIHFSFGGSNNESQQ